MEKKFKKLSLFMLILTTLVSSSFSQSIAYAAEPPATLNAEQILETFEGKFGAESAGSPTRLGGSDRYETAVKISQKGWTDGSSEFAVLSSGLDENLVDALTSSPLAYAKKAPILLTDTQELSNTTKAELHRLGVKTVYLTTGVAVFNSSVIKTLEEELNITVIPLGGLDRFETSINIAKELGSFREIMVSTAYSNADALSAASITAYKGIPILLSNVNGLPESTNNFISSLEVKPTKTYILGAEGVLSTAVEKSLPNSVRLGGIDRFATNVKIVTAFQNDLRTEKVYIANGQDDHLVDALAGSALAAHTASPMILTNNDSVPTGTRTLVKDSMFPVHAKNLVALGSEGVISNNLVNDLGTIVEYATPNATEGGTNSVVNINHGIAILADGVNVRNINAQYNVYVEGNNVKLNNISVGEALILNPGDNGKVDLTNVNAKAVYILSSGDPTVITDSNINVLMINGVKRVATQVNVDSNIGMTIVSSDAYLQEVKDWNNDFDTGRIYGDIVITSLPNATTIPHVDLSGLFKRPIIMSEGSLTNRSYNYLTEVIVSPYKEGANVTLEGMFDKVTVTKPVNFKLNGPISVSKSEINNLTIPSDSTMQFLGIVKLINYVD
ncbi:cell wall-binding repeat-containing protein [Desulfitobacterium sp. Sab5]|uniref:cell wall-binding repeat-containing protein n=1 Tax=Desulfitobacterium nosdiversum TaxID=3375356 RepID=UPI003CEA5AF2